MNRLLRRASRRFYLRHPWQLVLAIAGISLGVAVYVGVDLATDSAARAFDLSAALARGQATHRLLPIGGELDEDVYRELVTTRGIAIAAPVIETEVALLTRPDVRYPLLGIDPLEESGVRGFAALVPGRSPDLVRLITEPGAALLPEALAAETGAVAGSRLAIVVQGRQRVLDVVGTLAMAGGDVQGEPPIVTDIATAQELLDRAGVISHVDLRLTPEQARELAATPPPATVVVPADGSSRALTAMTDAFRTNLTALGLLALVVGMFLIYGTMSFAIVQRRASLGVLRALGVTRQELLGTVLLEALALGLLATSLGLLVGHSLANGLLELVLQTIGDLYFAAAVTAVAPSPGIYVQGAVLGVGATLLAAAKPALEAARASPAAALHRAALERGTRRGMRRAALAAVPVLALGALLLVSGSRSLYAGFAGLFAVLAAGALLTPAATVLLMRASEPAARALGRLPGVLAVRGVSVSLSRTGVATAALAVAVATVIGIGVMIASFRSSLVEWLGTTLTADLYVAFDGAGVALLEPQLSALAAVPGVAGISVSRTVRLPTPEGELAVRAARPGPEGWGLQVVSGEPVEALTELGQGRGLLASERFAFARNLGVGDRLVLPTPIGAESFEVLGTFRDFNTGIPAVVMSLELYRRVWDDPLSSAIGVHLEPGYDSAAVERSLRAVLPEGTAWRARSSDALVRLSLEIFDRTFKITEVLRTLAAFVAFLGVLSALLSIELERGRELAVLRALGFSPRQLATTLLTQTGLLGAAAGLAAMPIGAALAALLVHVINRRSFGWSMELTLTPGPLVTGLALAVTAALLAGCYPAWRASHVDLGSSLREE